MGDEGCRVICDAMRNMKAIERFNMSSNSAGPETVESLTALIRLTTSIKELDISCNAFGPEGCEQIRRAVERNTSLQMTDMRQCGATPDDELAVAENMRARQEKRDRAKVVG